MIKNSFNLLALPLGNAFEFVNNKIQFAENCISLNNRILIRFVYLKMYFKNINWFYSIHYQIEGAILRCFTFLQTTRIAKWNSTSLLRFSKRASCKLENKKPTIISFFS